MTNQIIIKLALLYWVLIEDFIQQDLSCVFIKDPISNFTMPDLNRFLIEDTTLRKYSPFVLFLLILSIVLADLIWPFNIIVHWEMVALIVVLTILPFIPLIKYISYGNLEVNLGEQVKDAEESIEEDLPIPEGVETSDYLPEGIVEKIFSLYDISHTAALAMLRTEIEVVLREIADEDDLDRPRSYGRLMNEITADAKLTRETIHAIEEVRSLANIAIHEKGVTENEAREIIDLGITALERLYYYKEEGVPKERE